MANESNTDYGPLSGLIGRWCGDKGVDIAPEPDGPDESPYYETIIYEAAGDIDNAAEQELAIVHYKQVVQRKSNDEVFHHQVGYWLWEPATGLIMHSFTIPRGFALVSGGQAEQQGDELQLRVAAGESAPEWQIAQAPYLQQKARTVSFDMQLQLKGDRLCYQQTTILDIYGNHRFAHTDENQLLRD